MLGHYAFETLYVTWSVETVYTRFSSYSEAVLFRTIVELEGFGLDKSTPEDYLEKILRRRMHEIWEYRFVKSVLTGMKTYDSCLEYLEALRDLASPEHAELANEYLCTYDAISDTYYDIAWEPCEGEAPNS